MESLKPIILIQVKKKQTLKNSLSNHPYSITFYQDFTHFFLNQAIVNLPAIPNLKENNFSFIKVYFVKYYHGSDFSVSFYLLQFAT